MAATLESRVVADTRTGRAMGTTFELIAVGRPDAAAAALDGAEFEIAALEAVWSRFVDYSDISRLNRAGGEPTPVAPSTALLIERAIEGWRRTDGLFDPSVLQAVVASGYDRDFAAIDRPVVVLPEQLDGGCDGIVVSHNHNGADVTAPIGVGFDPGGLGKGLAADLVCAAALDHSGVTGFLANIGGDLRVVGTPPPAADGAWVIAVPGAPGQPDRTLRLADGGVATSTCLRRRWATADGEAHHLIDPRSGTSSSRAALSVTVIAAEACDAEILATAIAARGSLPGDTAMIGEAAVFIVEHDRRWVTHNADGWSTQNADSDE